MNETDSERSHIFPVVFFVQLQHQIVFWDDWFDLKGIEIFLWRDQGIAVM